MQIYTLTRRDKLLLCLCLALVAFWIIFIIGAVICLIYCVQLALLEVENVALYTVVFVACVLALAAAAGAVTFVAFYFSRYKNRNFSSAFDGKRFIIHDGETEYAFTREDIVSRARCVLPRLIGKHDLTVKVRRFTVDGDVVIGVAQFTIIQLCEKSAREQAIKTFGIK